ncbi:TonB-dependent receptor plug domain-containing protein [Phenylobacterium sp.]|uniref:TonB-dependent receptor plug domain-containing protein n=1 Tax=Phenylobacterium sp. TaxID=1871053 RepID=UPI002CED081E|nr:TonB-dependent receptor [Phenylobacterium sp.]HVI32440.1 TonB-dependent receptor [Phenylobacterium sp.]
MLIVHMLAQAAAAATPEAVAAPQEGVISYPPAFFAAQQPANAHEMLLRLPGFAVETGDSVRGFEGAAGNVLIDGRRPTSKTDDLEEMLRRIPAGQVERIDLIRGGAPGIDMQGKTVLANVVRRSGAGLRGLIAVANNHLSDGRNMHGVRLELSGGSGGREWEGSARYGYGNDDGGNIGPQFRIGPNGEILRRSFVQNESDGLQKTVTAAFRQPLAGGRLGLNARYFNEKWKFEEDNRYLEPAALGVETTDDLYLTDQTEFGARWDRDFGARTKLELIGLRQDREREINSIFGDLSGTQDFRLQRDTAETIGRGVLKYTLNDRLSFEAGGEAALNELESRTALMVNSAAVDLPAANVDVEEKRGEVFAKAVWRPTTAWTVDAGVRFEASRISSEGDVELEKTLKFLKPRLALTWAPAPATQVRMRLERVVGQLNFDDFVASSDFNTGAGVSAGNPDLDPEQAWVAEAALEQRLFGATLVLTYRHSELTDVVDRGPVEGREVDPVTGAVTVRYFDTPMNIGDGTKDEAIVNLTAPLDRLGLKGALLKGQYTRRWSDVTDPTTFESRRISNLRPTEWEINYSQDLPQWRMSYGVDVYSGWTETSYRFDSIREVKLHNAYVRPWIEKRFQPDLAVRFEFPNVTSRGIRFTRQVWDGPRGASPRLYTDDRDLGFGRMYYVRVRKTFGA